MGRIEGPVLLHLLPLLREVGASVWISTAHLGALNETVRANAYTTIVLGLSNATDATVTARTLVLDQAQTAYQYQLKPGEGIMKTGKWPTPLLIEYQRRDDDKTVTPEEWQAAIERTNALSPQPLATNIITAAVPETPSQITATPNPEAKEAKTRQAALTVAEEALLRVIAKETIITTTAAYKAARLPYQVGDRAAKKQEALGFLQRDTITITKHPGRPPVALQLTKEGYERLGLKPVHGPRGGSSAQHTYLVVAISKYFPGSMIETTLGEHGNGGKSIDLLFHLNEATMALLDRLGLYPPYRSEDLPFEGGDFIAIEVETSSDTVLNNITKNHEVGVELTICALMPSALLAAQRVVERDLPATLRGNVVLVDVLDLMDRLNGKGATT